MLSVNVKSRLNFYNMFSYVKKLFCRQPVVLAKPVALKTVVNHGKPHFDKGDEIVISSDHYYNDYKTGDVGTVVDFSWDYPNWSYAVKFASGAVAGRTCSVWDTELKSNIGKTLDTRRFQEELAATTRDGQSGYQE